MFPEKLYTQDEMDAIGKIYWNAKKQFEEVRDARHKDINSGKLTYEKYEASMFTAQKPLYNNMIAKEKEWRDTFPFWKPVIGEGATYRVYTDEHACTITHISKSGKSFKIQRDKATRLTKPEFVPGGFAGHCTNNKNISYSYGKDPEGTIHDVRWTKWGWRCKSHSITKGRHEHYDYNF